MIAKPSRFAALLFAVALASCSCDDPQAVTGECNADGDCAAAGSVCLSNKCFSFVPTCSQCPDGYCTERCLAGVPGPKGDTGPQGPQGLQGIQGIQGEQGPQGLQGPSGPQGPRGDQGPQGLKGDTGSMGPQGSIGPQGPKGDPGSTGPQGSAGPAGPQGPAGQPGTPGTLYGEIASRFAGFTTATYSGNRGGQEAMHAACRAEFADSHLCHAAEYELSTSAAPAPAGGAWMDPSCALHFDNLGHVSQVCNNWSEAMPGMGRMAYVESISNNNCSRWTSNVSSVRGLTIQPSGGVAVACDAAKPLACCNTVFYEKFRGFTSASTTGGAGGRAAMHLRCAQEFPGSHLCHVAEYHRAHPALSPPASGVWIDASTIGNYGFSQTGSAMPGAGRYTYGGANDESCYNWTTSSLSNQGWSIKPGQTVRTRCDAALPLACCGG